jgi:hypothetical protein
MVSNQLTARWDVVATTQKALRYGGSSMRNIPGLVKRIINEDLWKEYLLPTGEITHFATFTAFITSVWGLDTTLATLLNICEEDTVACDLLDQVTTQRRGAKGGNQHAAKDPRPHEALFPHDDAIETNSDNVTICSSNEPERGNSRQYALRKLRRDAPAIHARVLAGELSPHKGMIEAGFRRAPTPLDYLHRYWRQVPPEDRRRFLREKLKEEEPAEFTAEDDA